MSVMYSKVLLTLLTCVNYLQLIKTDKMEGFIVGGNYSVIEDYPHVVYLHIDCGPKRRQACGGSVLNQAVILTAAHCVYPCRGVTKFKIYAFTGHVQKYKGYKSTVIGFKMHEDYIHKNFTNDVALMITERDLIFENKVQRVVLMKDPPKYEQAIIAGWGWIDDKGKKTALLKHTSQEIVSYEECFNVLSGIPIGSFCGREPDSSHPQRGDSGSGLMINKFIEIGLASHYKRQISNTTLVYTNVAYFYNWITNTAKQMCVEYDCSKPRCDGKVRVNPNNINDDKDNKDINNDNDKKDSNNKDNNNSENTDVDYDDEFAKHVLT